jgi:hypothetical protein
MILDISFVVCGRRTRSCKRSREGNVILQPSVNDTTAWLAPELAVKELGNVLPRLFDFMVMVPAEEHIHFSKIDLVNGYWYMVIEPKAGWNFTYVMPMAPGTTPTQLVISRALQMGWNESPAYFCAMTELVHDVAQAWIDQGSHKPQHPMESFTTLAKPACQQSSIGPAYQMLAVYVDAFLLAIVENAQGTLLK